MSHTDPYFMVRDEVKKSLGTAHTQHQLWHRLLTSGGGGGDELARVTGELRTTLRSIEWDLEDLEETVSIVERNPANFRLSPNELQSRRQFVDSSKRSLRELKRQLADPDSAGRLAGGAASAPLTSGINAPPGAGPASEAMGVTQQQQSLLIRAQDEQLEVMGDSLGVLKGMSRQIGDELDDQSRLLDDFGEEMSRTEGRLDTTMKKLARALNMASDRRQWCAIGILVLIALVVIVLLCVL